MSTPTLVIGLGGTGLKAATHIKKNMLEANRNKLPNEMALLVLDTEESIKYFAGGWGQDRSTEHATGPVRIDIGEYVAMSGNVEALGEEIKGEQKEAASNPALRRNQRYRHISNWFQAQYYLDIANVRKSIWSLKEGAGRYRQFGRLAFFRNIDVIEQKLTASIQAVQRASHGKTLHVHIIGSLAGGTGAALFADVAHMVHIICGRSQPPVVLGHFVLAEGFRGTRELDLNNPDNLRNFNARMFAGLREMTRLQSVIIRRTGGYPIVYDPQATGSRNSKLPGAPYDAIYLYDGVGGRIQLNQRPVENGLAPAIADVVTAYIDEKSGGAFRSHTVNLPSFYEAKNIPSGAVVYGSVGVYTIELPIYHITEGWAHRLGNEVLDKLLAPNPTTLDMDTKIPGDLIGNFPGGKSVSPQVEVDDFLNTRTTTLVRKIADWGRRAGTTTSTRSQVVREILALQADGWQAQLAGGDPNLATYVADAQAILKGSLLDNNEITGQYYVDINQGGSIAQERALNLQREVDDKLRAMIGSPRDVWKREGGEFRSALIKLGNHHVNEFDKALIKKVHDLLNGGTVGTIVEQKGGKLGFVIAFLSQLEKMLITAAQTLAMADGESQKNRKPQWEGIDFERNTAFAKLQQGKGLFGSTAKAYRAASNDMAQFQKADIAREVVYLMTERLHKDVSQLLNEARLWEQALATAIADNGGAYALLMQGMREIDSDRKKSQNAARWVIGDNEEGDTYISSKYARYAEGKLSGILEKVEWKVGQVDGNREMKIDFTLDGQKWEREAGQRRAINAGRRNVNYLLKHCREPFEQAWSDMSVTSYLYHNFFSGTHTISDLAEKIYMNNDYLLAQDPLVPLPTMRTAFVRVYQEALDTRGDQFLRDLRLAVDKRFDITTTIEERQNAQIKTAETGRQSEDVAAGQDYISALGQPSTDPYKISFLIFGDLLLPETIRAFKDGREAYRQFSGRGEYWRELQAFPADHNALQTELNINLEIEKRREFDPEVVTVMEDMGNFQVAMRCLAYGEADYHWDVGEHTGLLLHKHTPTRDNPSGHSFWRLVVMPEGHLGADGNIYSPDRSLALPRSIQLSDMAADPSLLEAFIRLTNSETVSSDVWKRIEDTVNQAMAWHRDQWPAPENLGWRLKPGSDIRLKGELKDKVAQLVRLNALEVWLKEQLAPDAWAWSADGGKVPDDVAHDPNLRVKIQKQVDLYTAIGGAARLEARTLSGRLMQIGHQHGLVPSEKITISTPFRATAYDEQDTSELGANVKVSEQKGNILDAPPGEGWLCPNSHLNPAEQKFCTQCAAPKPERVSAPVSSPESSTHDIVAAHGDVKCLNGHSMQADWMLCPVCGATQAHAPAPESTASSAAIECLNGHPMQAGWILCPLCGAAPKPKARRCANGHDMQPGWILCPLCGAAPATD